MHELSSENLRRVVPGICASGIFQWLLLRLSLDESWRLELRGMSSGKRRLVLRVDCFDDRGDLLSRSRLPLGTISTVAELRAWYQRLGGKGWE